MSMLLREKINKGHKVKKEDFKLFCKDKGRTRQEFVKDCDLNRIVDKYTKTGVLPFQGREKLGIYADVSELPDYKSALDFVMSARDSFAELNPNIRKRFHNNPQELLEFLSDSNNDEEARKLGLVKPKRPDVKDTKPLPPEPDPKPDSSKKEKSE